MLRSNTFRVVLTDEQEHILQFVNFIDRVEPLLITEYMLLGDLERQHRETPITPQEIIELLSQALEALQYLHDRQIVHRDIKPLNILVKERAPLSIVLADFGLSNQMDSSFLETLCGTRAYRTPEVFEGHGYFSAIDIWALGVVVLQFLGGLPEWREEYKSRMDRWVEIVSEAIQSFAHLNNDDDPCLSLLVKMLHLTSGTDPQPRSV